MLCFLLLTDHLGGNLLGASVVSLKTQLSTWPSFDPTNLMLQATYYVDQYPPISVTMLYNVEIQTLPGCNSTIGIWWYMALVGRIYKFFSYVSLVLKLQDITSISVMTMVKYSTISIFHRCFTHLLQPPSSTVPYTGPRAPTSSELETWSFKGCFTHYKVALLGEQCGKWYHYHPLSILSPRNNNWNISI